MPRTGAADLSVGRGGETAVEANAGTSNTGIPRILAAQLASIPGVQTVRPIVVRRTVVGVPGRESHAATLLGVDLTAEMARRQEPGEPGVRVGGLDPAGAVRARLQGRTPVLVGRALESVLSQGTTTDEIDLEIRINGAAPSFATCRDD